MKTRTMILIALVCFLALQVTDAQFLTKNRLLGTEPGGGPKLVIEPSELDSVSELNSMIGTEVAHGTDSDNYGPAYWIDVGDTSHDSGDEVCTAQTMTCVSVVRLAIGAGPTGDELILESCATDQTDTVPFFLVFCK